MELTKIIGLGLMSLVLITLLKNYHKEFAVPVTVATGVIFFLYVLTAIDSIFSYVRELCEQVGVDIVYIEVLFKVIGISYLCEFASSVCRDSGESAIAVKIDLAGKLLILSSSLPVFSELLKIVMKILP